jgi:hypothetical protein
MADDGSTALPPNIQEFNQIVLVVFSQLYVAHPMERTLDPTEIAAVIGVSPTGTLPSGRRFDEVFESTMQWLQTQGFTKSYGSYARERATLTARALVAMNAVPPALQTPSGTIPSLPKTSATTGSTIVEATKQAASYGNRTQLAELAGSFIGGIIKATLGS